MSAAADAVRDDVEFLDGVRAMEKVARRKAGLAAALSISEGDLVLDVGTGTGEDLQQFAAAAGLTGLGVGVEIVPGMAAEAKRRAEGLNVVLVVADVRRLPFRSEVFDAVYGERVLQHVPGPQRAVAEMYRVLVERGRVLLFEPDQDLRALDHPDRDTETLLRTLRSSKFANPSMGRQLFGLLTAAGFEVHAVEGTASGVPEVEISAHEAALQEAVAAGRLAQDTAGEYLIELERRVATGSAFSIWIAFEVTATKSRLAGVTRTGHGERL